jgi:hypothetical protein
MERGAWTEERLDDLATSMREGFARVDQDIRELRAEIAGLRTEMREEIGGVRAEVDALRQTMIRVGGGMLAAMCIGFLSILVAVLTRGV